MKKLQECKRYKSIFDDVIENNIPITTNDKKEKLVITDGEIWKQCYKYGDKVRDKLPTYWFISDKGNLISVKHGKPRLLKKDYLNGRYSYHFNINIDDETKIKKNIEGHNLVRLVFGGLSYGKADDLLDEDGIFAFGIRTNKKLTLQGHHIGKKEDNSPYNIELLSANAHKVLHKASTVGLNDIKDIKKILVEFERMASEEEPNKISVLFTGQKVDKNTLEITDNNEIKLLDTMESNDNIKLSKQELQKLQSMCIIDNAIVMLLDTYGMDYLEEPKYLTTRVGEYRFYKCENVADEICITETNDTRELAGKDYIMCYFNENNEVECNIQKDEVK